MESPITYRVAYGVMVIAWAVFWPVVGYSYHDSNKKQAPGRTVRVPLINRFLLAIVFLASCICLASPRWNSHLLWVANWPSLVVGVILLLLLLGIAYNAARLLAWQPIQLGEHRATVFADGPFAWVRHPTYVCITGASWVTALLLARPLSLYAAGCVTLAHFVLILIEERSTRGVDPAGYDAYAARVPMLIPWRFGRSPRPEAVSDDPALTTEALFAEAEPVVSQQAKLGAKRAAKGGDTGERGAGGKKGKGGRKGKVRADQPQLEAEENPRSRAWQMLEGNHD